jgi:hypothetical protein
MYRKTCSAHSWSDGVAEAAARARSHSPCRIDALLMGTARRQAAASLWDPLFGVSWGSALAEPRATGAPSCHNLMCRNDVLVRCHPIPHSPERVSRLKMLQKPFCFLDRFRRLSVYAFVHLELHDGRSEDESECQRQPELPVEVDPMQLLCRRCAKVAAHIHAVCNPSVPRTHLTSSLPLSTNKSPCLQPSVVWPVRVRVPRCTPSQLEAVPAILGLGKCLRLQLCQIPEADLRRRLSSVAVRCPGRPQGR